VRNVIGDIGYNAGKVWSVLNGKGSLEKERILEIVNISDGEFYSAIGWLARENKISMDNQNSYKLGETNLTPEIGNNAGKVWRVMKVWGEVDISLIR
jgi:hypothetical protein